MACYSNMAVPAVSPVLCKYTAKEPVQSTITAVRVYHNTTTVTTTTTTTTTSVTATTATATPARTALAVKPSHRVAPQVAFRARRRCWKVHRADRGNAAFAGRGTSLGAVRVASSAGAMCTVVAVGACLTHGRWRTLDRLWHAVGVSVVGGKRMLKPRQVLDVGQGMARRWAR